MKLRLSRCRSCGATVYWMKTRAGGQAIVDAETVTVVDAADADLLFDPKRHRSHFATCPDADQWRKANKRHEQT